MTITFPTYTTVLTGSTQLNATPIINRTQMESGPAKQAPNQSYSFPQQQLYIVFSVDQFEDFNTWFVDPDNGNYGASFFNWTDPQFSTTRSARIVGGAYGPVQPLTATSNYLVMQVTFEYQD
jgi:hypothetical protein